MDPVSSMRSSLRTLLCAYLFFIVTFAHATTSEPLEDWHKLSTQHVVLYTDFDLDTAKDVIDKVNIFRSVIMQFMKGVEKPESQPLTMIIFRDNSMWRKHRLSKKAAGYFTFPIYGPLAVIGADGRKPNIETVYHEYVHYLVNQYVPVRYPDWYNEGMAEFFSSVAIEDDYVYIGAIPERSVKGLEAYGLMRPKQLFSELSIASKSHGDMSEFYPSAWLTAHYFTLGARNGFPSHYKSNIAFMDKVRNGETVEQAFTDSFDISMGDLYKELARYARSTSKTGFAIDRPKLEHEITVEKLTSANAKGRLAAVFGWRDNDSFGRELLLDAAEQKDAFALSVRATHFATQGDKTATDQVLGQLSDWEELDADVLFNIARATDILGRRLHKEGKIDAAREYYYKSQDALFASMEKQPYMPSLRMHMFRVMRNGSKEETLNVIDKLLSHFGNHYQAQLDAAKAYARLNEVPLALRAVNRAMDLLPHSGANIKAIESIIKELTSLTDKIEP
jgi:tetratricopeptide (TPR) repeat protein